MPSMPSTSATVDKAAVPISVVPSFPITVKATREGLVGCCTASGWIVDTKRLFVALPSRKALHRKVKVTNIKNGKSVIAEVLDVGPWNVSDDNYVLRGKRPLSESGVSLSGKGTNGAGIDLGEAVWKALGMVDNTSVSWVFV
jgi:hypothetical protein